MHLGERLFYIPGDTDKEQEIKQSSARDWINFLLARSAEMKKGEYVIERLWQDCLCTIYLYLSYTLILQLRWVYYKYNFLSHIVL
jgi:hypothetical protein